MKKDQSDLHQIQNFTIPDNLAEYVKGCGGANISVNINSTSCLDGYGHVIRYSVALKRITRTCHHCGFDVLWNPDDTNSKCTRHTYGDWRYDDIFVWHGNTADQFISLKDAFDVWLQAQPKLYYKAAKKMTFGRNEWR